MKHASRTGILTVFLLLFVAMVACLASPSVWIAWSAELGSSTVTPTTGEPPPEYLGIDLQCRAELEKLCEGIQPGGGRLKKCYQDNESKLSPACYRQVQERKKEGTDYSPIALTKQAIVELTDAPGLGARTTVDLNKRWGSDLSQNNKAVALLQDARSQAGGSGPAAIRLLEESISYGKAKLHKEARVSAQGALFYLCKENSGAEGCDKVPKFGPYVAP